MVLSRPELITASHEVSQFNCGEPSLNRWLTTHALRNQTEGFTAVVVVHDAGRVVAYYGMAPTAIVKSSLPRSIRTGQAPEPVPCLLIGQLAVDIDYAGSGVGAALTTDALQRAVKASELIGGRAVAVDALNPRAAAFWQKMGFVPSLDNPLKLFRPMHQIAASLKAANR